MQVHTGGIPFTNSININQFLRVKYDGTDLAVAGDEDDLGTVPQEYQSTDGVATVLPYNLAGSRKMIAAAAIDTSSGAVQVYAAAGGKVSDTGTRKRGAAISTTTADGDVVEVVVAPPYI